MVTNPHTIDMRLLAFELELPFAPNDAALLEYAKKRSLREHVFEDGETTYITRYVIKELPAGGKAYLHRFHRGDSDPELHNHPWSGKSLILYGGYVEERLRQNGSTVFQKFLPGNENRLEADTFHRVELLAECCWTLFVVSPKFQSWGFLDKATKKFTPWEIFIREKGRIPAKSVGGADAGTPNENGARATAGAASEDQEEG
jgi:hypothetical protein